MPTYEYRCKDCEHELEAVQGFHDDPLTECPSCGGTLRKKFGSVGISFKGSGFYKNDSRSTASSSTGGDSTSSGDGASTSTSSTSTKESTSKESTSSSATSGDGGTSKPSSTAAAAT